MSRSDFGWWGSDLDDAGFARALAALGTYAAHAKHMPPPTDVEMLKQSLVAAWTDSEILPWELVADPDRTAEYATPPDANTLRLAWTEIQARGGRLEIQPDTKGASILPWMVEQLSRDDVGLQSVYVGIKAPRTPVRWSWPMRVGLLDYPESARLRRELQNAWWAERFVSFETVGSASEPRDLLILPWSLRRGLGELLRQPHRLRAHCIIVLGGINDPWDRAHSLIGALLAEVNAAGICVVSIGSDEWREWFNHFLAELAHDQPLDVVFRTIAREHKGPAPLLFASRQLLANSRMSNLVHELIGRLQRMRSETEFDVPDPIRSIIGATRGPKGVRELASELETYSRDFLYDHESGEASGLADLMKEALRTSAQTLPAEPRWIQGQVFEQGREGGPGHVERALRAGARHLLVVRIGPADEEWLTPPNEAVFPDRELAWEEDQHELRVVFHEPNHAPEPQTTTLILPREGPSTTCQFPFQTRTDVSTFKGRVIVLHRNRVLQTALLEGQVLPDPTEASEELSLQMNIEGIIRPNLNGLEARQEFDLALVANHTPEDEPAITTIAHEQATFRSLVNVQQPIDEILWLLQNLADSPDDHPKDLWANNNVQLLSDLAFYGSALYDGIVSRQIGGERLQSIEHIQLISARDEYLPLEFLYDFPAPKEDASLCPNAVQALEKGACPDCAGLTQTPGQGADYVCPLGFWCMRLVIERHGIKPSQRPDLQGDAFALRSTPVPGRSKLKVLSSALFAASTRVDAVVQGRTQKVFQTLQEATGEHATQVAAWDAWVKAVDDTKPSLLVLLPHTSKGGRRNWPQLEIGQDQQLIEGHITERHVRTALETDPPVVLLLGCETLAPDVGVGDFTIAFQNKGAAIVLSTLTPVLGRDVGPIAELLVQKLKEAAQAHRTFGYALRELRRQTMAKGTLMILCLVAHGDADWQLETIERIQDA